MIDSDGYRPNVGIIVANDQGQVLWARRVGQDDVGAGGVEVLADLRRQTKTAGRVLGVDEDQVEAEPLAPARQLVVDGLARGTADDVVGGFDRDGLGAVVNSSSGILYAFEKNPDATCYADAAATAAREMQEAIETAREAKN